MHNIKMKIPFPVAERKIEMQKGRDKRPEKENNSKREQYCDEEEKKLDAKER